MVEQARRVGRRPHFGFATGEGLDWAEGNAELSSIDSDRLQSRALKESGATVAEQGAAEGSVIGAGDGSDPSQAEWARRLAELRALRADLNQLMSRVDVLADITLAGPRLASPDLRLVEPPPQPLDGWR